MRSWLACLVALLLAACAESPPLPDATLTLGPPLQRLTADGRISLRQGDRRDHLRFRWEHAPDSDVVLLMSPLGQGLAELSRDASGARLSRPNQPVIAADSLPQLAQRVFGAPLPLEAMADWLRGARPALSGEVDGWRVTISETLLVRTLSAGDSASRAGKGRLLRVMEASREDVDFKLIVDDWDVPE
ncbi:MAG: outer membrane lipoprotein LolB [Sulfuritalea sp.]|jgi:outer membrane lipoprotein LolB|nr:outer membrane lipoprotein LolB [Sulfuritalea sp.]